MPSRLSPRALGALFVIVIAGGLAQAFWPRAEPAPKARPPVPVKVSPALQQDYPLTLVTVGRVQASETVTLRARVDGQVQQVLMKEGSLVRAGDVLLTLDSAEFKTRLTQAEAALARDEAQLANARTELARYEALKEKNYVSDDMLRNSRTNVAALAATVKSSKAAVDNARLQLSWTQIRAPFGGRVGARLVFPGSAVKTNDTALAVINQVHPVQVAFSVPEKFLGALQGLRHGKSLPVHIHADADPQLAASGRLDFMDNAVDAATGSIQLKATFANQDDRLTPGAIVTVTVALATLKNAVVIPAQALLQNGDDSKVYVLAADGKAELRTVSVRDSRGSVAAIASGLSAGERVITDGLLRLSPGASVRVLDDAATPAGATAKGR